MINGSKTFITNGSSADVTAMTVKTDPKAGAKGVSMGVVDLRDQPEFAVDRVLDKVGQHGADTSTTASSRTCAVSPTLPKPRWPNTG